MSIDNTEVMDSYDDYDAEDTGVTQTAESREVDQVDQVAALLMGEDPGEISGKSNDKPWSSISVDESGKRDYTTNKVEDKSYLDAASNNQTAPDMMAPAQKIEHFENVAQSVQKAHRDLEERFRNGEISQTEAQSQFEYLQGMGAAAVMQHQAAQLEQMQNQQWLSEQQAAVRAKHGDIFDNPAKRDAYSKRMIEYLGGIGYSKEELSGIGAREYSAVLDMLRLQDRNNELEMQNKMLVKEKKERQRTLKQGQRDSSVGSRGKSGGLDAQIDEVSRILMTPRRG
jgi:hypothetical protein